MDQVCGIGTKVRALNIGRYSARLAQDPADLAQAMALRAQVFRPRQSGVQDRDAYDAACSHMVIHDSASGDLVCCFRALLLADAGDLAAIYAAQFYDLSRLAGFGGPLLELGRFCVKPGHSDGDILRLAWAALARLVDQTDTRLLFGCSSFDGTDGAAHDAAFAQLRAHHLAPDLWRPQRRAPLIYDFGRVLADTPPDPRAALRAMPPLLRTYLAMGGWVSDHAVIDPDLNTLHVFTAVEIANIPAARAAALRAIAT